MNISEEHEIKKEFQLERIIFFSDAVFAIIITIMVLDLKLPEVTAKNATEKDLLQLFLHVIPRMLAYIISFAVIGSSWMKHLRIFSFLKDFNMQLVALNLLFLFSISLFPFAMSFIFISTEYIRYPWGIYTYIGIIYFTYLTQTMLIAYLMRNKHLCIQINKFDAAVQWKIRKIEFVAVPVIFILMITASLFHLNAYIVYGSVIVYRFMIRFLRKRYYPHYKQERLTLRSFFIRNKHDSLTEQLTNRF
jgi:uncharacterized membrane protein